MNPYQAILEGQGVLLDWLGDIAIMGVFSIALSGLACFLVLAIYGSLWFRLRSIEQRLLEKLESREEAQEREPDTGGKSLIE